MYCRTCDYPLWNIVDRTCPECGTSFRVSEHAFVRGAVVFRCPDCSASVQGTDENGHPAPAAFDCAGCGRSLHVDDLVLEPLKGVREEQTRTGVVPWTERAHRGTLKAFFQTIGMALVRPVRLAGGLRDGDSVGESLVFAFLLLALAQVLGSGALIVLFSGSVWFGGMGGGGMGLWWAVIWAVFYLLITGASALFFVVFWPMTIHGLLRVTGGCRHGIDRTFLAIGYSTGANAASAVPCIGPYLGWIWWVVSAVIMVAAAQHVHARRAAFAVLALPGLILLLLCGWIGMTTFGNLGMFTGAGGQGIGQQQTYGMSYAVIMHTTQNGGVQPEHGLELMLTQQQMISAWGGGTAFCERGTATTANDVPFGDGTLASYLTATRAQQLSQLQAALDTVPPNCVAHRVGDFVFTYHGGPANGMDPNFWVVVMVPDPDVNGVPAPGDPVHIGLGNYSVRTITYGQLSAELQKQNTHRATLGLAPLPDPATVTHDSPATAPVAP